MSRQTAYRWVRRFRAEVIAGYCRPHLPENSKKPFLRRGL
jgi:hypothetical protein